MSHWNYRVFRREYPGTIDVPVGYELHEVYYNSAGQIVAWSTEPEAGPAESVDELIEELEMRLRDAERCREDILNYDMEPEGDWD